MWLHQADQDAQTNDLMKLKWHVEIQIIFDFLLNPVLVIWKQILWDVLCNNEHYGCLKGQIFFVRQCPKISLSCIRYFRIEYKKKKWQTDAKHGHIGVQGSRNSLDFEACV